MDKRARGPQGPRSGRTSTESGIRMRRIAQFLVFFSLFMTMSFLINLYVFLHASAMFGFEHTPWFWLLLLISSVSFFAIMYLESSNLISKALVVIVSAWMGVVVIALFLLIGYDVLRQFMTLEPRAVGWTVVLTTSILAAAGLVNALFVRLRTVEITSKKLKRDLRLAHLSDFHLGPVHGPGYFAKVARRVKELNPDVVLITGDLLDSTERSARLSFEVLNELEAPVLLSTGNHEYYLGLDEVAKAVGGQNLRLVRNEVVDLGDFQVAAVDDNAFRRDLKEALNTLEIDRRKFTILMHHQPIALDEVSRRGFDLMVAGHTHGGQMFMFVVLARLIWKYPAGLYKFGDTYLHTLAGTGTWGPPMRLGTSSEFALITVRGMGGKVEDRGSLELPATPLVPDKARAPGRTGGPIPSAEPR